MLTLLVGHDSGTVKLSLEPNQKFIRQSTLWATQERYRTTNIDKAPLIGWL
jgi:hypothetical protein